MTVTELELELIRRRVKLRAYSSWALLKTPQQGMVGRARAEEDIELLLDEIDRLRELLQQRAA